MNIKLSNFGCYESKELSLPDTGRVLLRGDSGTGKSTICRGIMFALTGKGQKLVKHGKKKCEVVFEYRGLKITRQKGPAKLVLVYNDKTYEEEIAQTIINQYYPSPTTFYMDQDQHFNLLKMTPKDQLETLQNLTGFSNSYIKFITEKHKQLKLEQLENQYKLNAVQTILGRESPPEETEEQLLHDQVVLIERVKYISDMMRQQEQSLSVMSDRKILEAQLQAIIVDDYEPIQSELSLIQGDLDYLILQEKYNAREKRTRLKKELNALPVVDVETLSRHQSEYTKRTKLQAELNSLPSAPSETSLVETDEKLRSLELSRNRYECPSCDTMVYLDDKHLKACSDHDSEQIVLDKIEQYSNELSEMKSVLKKRNRLEGKIENLHPCNVSVELATSREVHDKKVMLKQQLSTCVRVDPSELAGFVPRDTIPDKNNLQERRRELEVKLGILKRNEDDRVRIMNKLSRLPSTGGDKTQFPDDLAEQYTVASERVQDVRDKIRRLPLQEQVKESIRLNNELSRLTRDSVTAYELLGMIKDAERFSLNSFIERINNEIVPYLDEFYDEPPIFCVKAAEKKISIVLNLDGYDISVQNLSGGEQDRLLLALTCALSNITDARFMILDESVSSLDWNTSSMVFEAMSKFKDDKLIIYIAHGMVDGHYDQVIDVSK